MRVFSDTWVMFKRSMITSMLRNQEAMIMAVVNPTLVMFLFGAIFGGLVDMGDFNYIDFIVPGIILQSIAQGIVATAVTVNNDMTRGIIDRFRSMPITKSAVLTGHVLSSSVRNSVTTAVVIGVAIGVGFRPQAGFLDWIVISAIILLFMLAVTWLAVLAGVAAKAADSAASSLFLLFILPFLSSGFAPIETLPRWLRFVAQHQPMTPIIDALRGLMLGIPSGNALPLALAWSIGTIVVAFIIAVQVYKRKLA